MHRLSESPDVVESCGGGSTMWKKANFGDIESLYDPTKTFRLTSENARRAFNKEVLPYLEDIQIFSVVQLDDLYDIFKSKIFPMAQSGADHPTYVRLVHHKSLDSTDDQFFEDLNFVLDKWHERFRDRLEQRNGQL